MTTEPQFGFGVFDWLGFALFLISEIQPFKSFEALQMYHVVHSLRNVSLIYLSVKQSDGRYSAKRILNSEEVLVTTFLFLL